MELGCDVISEKPMTIDEVKCQQILDTIRKTGRKLRVTFNYRYAPHSTKVREVMVPRKRLRNQQPAPESSVRIRCQPTCEQVKFAVGKISPYRLQIDSPDTGVDFDIAR